MQAVYSLWDYVPLKKYRTYGIFPHFFVHEYAAIVSTSKKNTEHMVYVHKIPYMYTVFSHIFFVHEYVGIVSISKKNTEHTVHVHNCLDYRTNTCAYTYCRLCPSGKKCRTYGTFQLVFEFCQHHAGGVFTLGIVSISKNTEHTVFSHNGLGYCTNTNMLQLCPSLKIPSIR